MARLTLLGWMCIGNPGSGNRTAVQTHFARTYFVKDRAEIEQLNTNLKRFWEIDDMSIAKIRTLEHKPILRLTESRILYQV